MKKIYLSSLLLVGVILSATAMAAGDAANGKTLFATTCMACHGVDAKGITGLGKDLTASAFSKKLTDAQLVAFIEKGRDVSDPANTTHVPMPPKGGNASLTDVQIGDIVAYIRTLQK